MNKKYIIFKKKHLQINIKIEKLKIVQNYFVSSNFFLYIYNGASQCDNGCFSNYFSI